MINFRRRETIYAKPSWRQRIWQIVSFPFRGWLRVFVLVVLLLLLLPLLWGAKLWELHNWYGQKFSEMSTSLETSVIGKTLKESPFARKGTDKLVESTDYRSKNIRRQAFGKVEITPEGVDAASIEDGSADGNVPFFVPETEGGAELKFVNNAQSAASVIKIPTERTAVQKTDEVLYEDMDYRRDVEGLVYLENPKIVEGKPLIYNANAIDLNGEYIFLFGIYANPETEEGARAKAFLEREIENKPIVCKIVAYTAEEVATAFCYFNGININKFMADNRLSQNVAL